MRKNSLIITRITPLVLVLALVFASMPFMMVKAYAQEISVSTEDELISAFRNSAISVITIAQDIDLTRTVGTGTGRTITLRGNHTIRTSSTINASGGHLILDGPTLKAREGVSLSIVSAFSNGTFTMESGEIIGHFRYAGGGTGWVGARGVWVQPGGTFNMRGGTISNGLNGVQIGGGAYGGVSEGRVSAPLFIMDGGTISGNRWGITLLNENSFIMNNGTITGNNIGLHIRTPSGNPTVQLLGGTISGNTTFDVRDNREDPPQITQPQQPQPQPPVSEAIPFADVSATAWYSNYVSVVNELGLMTGVAHREFNPNGTVTYAQAITTLWRDAGEPGATAGGTWYSDAVAWARNNGFELGGSGPNDRITRQNIAMLFEWYANYASIDLTAVRDYAGFSDTTNTAVRTLYQAGIINGVGGGRFDPQGNTIRAQFAALLTRLLTD